MQIPMYQSLSPGHKFVAQLVAANPDALIPVNKLFEHRVSIMGEVGCIPQEHPVFHDGPHIAVAEACRKSSKQVCFQIKLRAVKGARRNKFPHLLRQSG